MTRTLAIRCLAPLLAALALDALAQNVSTTQPVNMRAGPDPRFPLVTWLPARTTAHVVGCLPDWTWCDVTVGRNRGWVSGRYLSSHVRSRPANLAFSVDAYWDEHYRNLPWYSTKAKWTDWQSPAFEPPALPDRTVRLLR